MTPRLVYFFTALALRQKEPEVAIESIQMIPRMRTAVGQSLKVMGLADLKRFDDIIYSIKNIMNSDRLPEKGFILSEAVSPHRIRVYHNKNVHTFSRLPKQPGKSRQLVMPSLKRNGKIFIKLSKKTTWFQMMI